MRSTSTSPSSRQQQRQERPNKRPPLFATGEHPVSNKHSSTTKAHSPAIDWNMGHASEFTSIIGVLGHTILQNSSLHSSSPSSSECWDRPTRSIFLEGAATLNPHAIRSSADMNLKILPSTVQFAQNLRARPGSPHSNELKQKSTRVWVATFTAPRNTSLDTEFFDSFPQKHQVVAGIECRGEVVLIGVISFDLHSLGTVCRKIQNAVIFSSQILDVRFEVLEQQIFRLLKECQSGSIKMTSTRPKYEAMFQNTLLPSLFGVRWIKELMLLLVNTVKLEPLEDDVLVSRADKASIAIALEQRREVVVAVHRAMHLRVVAPGTTERLEKLCFQRLAPLLVEMSIQQPDMLSFDHEFGQVLAVLEHLGELEIFFQSVNRTWQGAQQLTRPPVAWLDGLARTHLRDLVAGSSSVGSPSPSPSPSPPPSPPPLLQAPPSPTSVALIDNDELALPTNLSQATEPGSPTKFISVKKSLALLDGSTCSQLSSDSMTKPVPCKPSRVLLLPKKRMLVAEEISDNGFLGRNSSETKTEEQSSSIQHSFLLSSPVPCLAEISTENEIAQSFIEPQQEFSFFETPLSFKPELKIYYSPQLSAIPILSSVENLSFLGEDTIMRLQQANIKDIESLLVFSEAQLSNLDLKLGPLLRLRLILRKIRSMRFRIADSVNMNAPDGMPALDEWVL